MLAVRGGSWLVASWQPLVMWYLCMAGNSLPITSTSIIAYKQTSTPYAMPTYHYHPYRDAYLACLECRAARSPIQLHLRIRTTSSLPALVGGFGGCPAVSSASPRALTLNFALALMPSSHRTHVLGATEAASLRKATEDDGKPAVGHCNSG